MLYSNFGQRDSYILERGELIRFNLHNMALFVSGIRCPLCGKPIHSAAEAEMFAPFVSNRADPLRLFDDAVVNAACMNEHPLAAAARAPYAELPQSTHPQIRGRSVGAKQI